MDTSDPDIRFDREGICNHCREFNRKLSEQQETGDLRERRLQSVVTTIKEYGSRNEYDCVVGVSGGVDSTYTIYLAKQLGLRPLAVHVDNGWNSELAVSNIERVMRFLNVDLYTCVLDWAEFRRLQLAFLRASVVNCEIPTDHAINAALFDVARVKKIKYILHGANHVTEGILPFSWVYINKDLRFITAINRKFGTGRLKRLPKLSLGKFAWCSLVRGIKVVRLLEYVNYNKEETIKILQRELGWRDYGGKHYESIYTRFYQGYVLPKKFNIDKRRAHLSTLVCSGQITRANALKIVSTPPYSSKELEEGDKVYVLKKLGLSEGEFEEIMQLPRRDFSEYASNYRVFAVARRFKSLLGKCKWVGP